MKNILAILAGLLLFCSPVYGAPIGNPIAFVNSAAAESNHVVLAQAGYLNGISITSGASAGYLLIFDAITAPGDGAVLPKFCYSIPAATSFALSWLSYPVPFAIGITAVFSTTGCFTKTASATAFFNAQVQKQ